MSSEENVEPGSRRAGSSNSFLPVLLLALILAAGGAYYFLQSDTTAPTPPQELPAPPRDVVLERGLVLYEKNCVSCHGAEGLGDGTAAYLLYPKPRDFSSGSFRITSRQRGLPGDDDMIRTLRYGMPGSSMPPWGHLPEEDLTALVRAIRHLATEGKVLQLMEPDEYGETISEKEAREIAHNFLKSGDRVQLPARPAAAGIDPELGQKVYMKFCAACHDEDGRGRKKRDLVDSDGYALYARDFTQGVFKGGSEPEDLAYRISAGIPGGPMPGAEMKPEELWSLVEHVRGMIKPGAQERVQQVRKVLSVKNVAGDLSPDPDSAVWKNAPATFLPLMPLWWRDDRVEGATFRAVHNGSQVAIYLSWKDASKNDQILHQSFFGDGAGIQFTESPDPPLFAMGTKDAQVNIWYWRAVRERELKDGPTSLKTAHPWMPDKKEDAYPGTPEEATFSTGEGAGNPISAPKHKSAFDDLNAAGFGTLTAQGAPGQNVRGVARRDSDGWHVVFVRDLKSADNGDVKLEAGKTVQMALAIWDGAAGDRNGQKSVTIWHQLSLE